MVRTSLVPPPEELDGAPNSIEPAEKLQVQVISRASSILSALENQPAGLSLGQIAAQVGLPRSTVQRIAGALQAERMLVAASPNGRLRLGPALLRLARSVESDTLTIARPVLHELSVEIEETVDLAAVKGSNLVFIDQIASTQRLRTVSAVGEEFPLYCSANGKAYLATLSDEAVSRLVGSGLLRRTPRTLTTLQALLAELSRIRKSGVAFDLEEHTEGIAAVGVSLLDSTGNPLLVSVPVPAARFDQKRDTITRCLVQAKGRLDARFQNG